MKILFPPSQKNPWNNIVNLTLFRCTWLVEATNPGSRIRLHLKDFETECGYEYFLYSTTPWYNDISQRWDHLYIWDGDNIFSGLQAVYSGLVKTKDKSYKTSSVSEVRSEPETTCQTKSTFRWLGSLGPCCSTSTAMLPTT